MTFENDVIESTVNRLLNGDDYREEVVKSINAVFLDFTINFFKKIVEAKMNDEGITLEWYKKYFILGNNFSADEAAIYAGINKKTITNMYGTATKEVVLNVANENFEYLSNVIGELEKDSSTGIAINIKISYKNVTVDLSLTESLLVINALATKKIQLRGGAWSSIGKKLKNLCWINYVRLWVYHLQILITHTLEKIKLNPMIEKLTINLLVKLEKIIE